MPKKKVDDRSQKIQEKVRGNKVDPGSSSTPKSERGKPASETAGDPMSDSGGTCRCTVCGNAVPKGDVPCNQLRCSECGGVMAE